MDGSWTQRTLPGFSVLERILDRAKFLQSGKPAKDQVAVNGQLLRLLLRLQELVRFDKLGHDCLFKGFQKMTRGHCGLGSRCLSINNWLVKLCTENLAFDLEKGGSAFWANVREHRS